MKLTVESEWEKWKKNFCETFGSKGWSPIRYALSFKYQTGSLLEYAIKKEKLLLEVRKTIDTGTLIDLIANGLPNFVADRIDRETLTETKDLYNDIGKWEHLVQINKFERKNKTPDTKEKVEKTPCKNCKDRNKGIRFHPESACWFRDNKIKMVNNATLETELNYEPKNSESHH